MINIGIYNELNLSDDDSYFKEKKLIESNDTLYERNVL